MKEKDLNEIAKIEKAIKEKYGEDAIQNPKRLWDEEKEKKYLEDLKSFHERPRRTEETKKTEDFKIKSRKSCHEISRNCPVCDSYSFSGIDDLYMTKFECCFKCYVQHIEGREGRWKSGWRPNN